jgi:hypothetical protein
MSQSNYYDSWAHAREIFFTRFVEFLALALASAVALWLAILHWHFDMLWLAAVRWTLFQARNQGDIWYLVMELCGLAGFLFSAWMFTWLSMRKRPSRGDRYQRGARIMHADEE